MLAGVKFPHQFRRGHSARTRGVEVRLRLTRRQRERLHEMATAQIQGTSSLMDEPEGACAASAWWRTMRALEAKGLVVRVRGMDRSLRDAFRSSPKR